MLSWAAVADALSRLWQRQQQHSAVGTGTTPVVLLPPLATFAPEMLAAVEAAAEAVALAGRLSSPSDVEAGVAGGVGGDGDDGGGGGIDADGVSGAIVVAAAPVGAAAAATAATATAVATTTAGDRMDTSATATAATTTAAADSGALTEPRVSATEGDEEKQKVDATQAVVAGGKAAAGGEAAAAPAPAAPSRKRAAALAAAPQPSRKQPARARTAPVRLDDEIQVQDLQPSPSTRPSFCPSLDRSNFP